MATREAKEKIEAFFKSKTRIALRKNEILIRPEDIPSGVFWIEEGFIKAYAITKYGEINSLIVRNNGSIFPLIWVFTNQHRAITYEAMEPAVVWRAPKEEYLEFIKANPDAMEYILEMAIESYHRHAERVKTLGYRTARERICSYLVYCCERFGKEMNNEILIDAPFKQSDIATSVNATRETTSRELNSLKKRGVIRISEHNIVVLDKEALEKIL